MVDINKAYWGNQNVKHIYFGSDHVKRIYKGNELIYIYGWNPVTFNPSGSLQTFTVPAGTNKIHVDCVASKGFNGKATAGKGGRVQCDINVTPGQTLYIMVGAIPSSNTNSYNASDIRTNNAGVTNTTSLNSRLVVAGGGGNAGNGEHSVNGGAGGGTTGGNGVTTGHSGTQAGGGKGGTQSAGGAAGTGDYKGSAGSFGLGGAKGSLNGGAGGAGWYGGGAGATEGHDGHYWNAGGGGGSSYTNGTYCSNVIHTQGFMNGSGYVTISYVEV